MKTATLRFEPAGWEIEIYPATKENEAYVEAMRILAMPHQLAMELGKLTEERAQGILMNVAAETLIKGSSTPGLPDSASGWHAWLIEHPEEFLVLMQTALLPDDWESMADGASKNDIP